MVIARWRTSPSPCLPYQTSGSRMIAPDQRSRIDSRNGRSTSVANCVVRRGQSAHGGAPIDDRSEHRLDAAEDQRAGNRPAWRTARLTGGRAAQPSTSAGGGSIELAQLAADEAARRVALQNADRSREIVGAEQIVLVEGDRVLAAPGGDRLEHVAHRAEPCRVALVSHSRVAERLDVGSRYSSDAPSSSSVISKSWNVCASIASTHRRRGRRAGDSRGC